MATRKRGSFSAWWHLLYGCDNMNGPREALASGFDGLTAAMA